MEIIIIIIIKHTLTYIPELFRFVEATYGKDSILAFGSFTIQSAEGLQQGDPLGPLLFCLTVHEVLRNCDTDLKIGFIDDLTLGGEANKTLNELDILESSLANLGLNVNLKCELITLSGSAKVVGHGRRPDFKQVEQKTSV